MENDSSDENEQHDDQATPRRSGLYYYGYPPLTTEPHHHIQVNTGRRRIFLHPQVVESCCQHCLSVLTLSLAAHTQTIIQWQTHMAYLNVLIVEAATTGPLKITPNNPWQLPATVLKTLRQAATATAAKHIARLHWATR
jgi:hypothetical protein